MYKQVPHPPVPAEFAGVRGSVSEPAEPDRAELEADELVHTGLWDDLAGFVTSRLAASDRSMVR